MVSVWSNCVQQNTKQNKKCYLVGVGGGIWGWSGSRVVGVVGGGGHSGTYGVPGD